jgi:hypothetical protein
MAAEGLSDEHRELLERYAPCLAYDPQDGFRATPAATMTDNPRNALRREDGEEIAAGAVLQLATLVDYPGQQRFKTGDHLAADGEATDLLLDAMRMQGQPSYPYTAYGRVVASDGQVWLQYWLWYYDNPNTFAGRGRHQGDWELVQIGLGDDGSATCSQHNVGETRDWDRLPRHPDASDHPLIYVAPFSHANYCTATLRSSRTAECSVGWLGYVHLPTFQMRSFKRLAAGRRASSQNLPGSSQRVCWATGASGLLPPSLRASPQSIPRSAPHRPGHVCHEPNGSIAGRALTPLPVGWSAAGK